MLTPSNKRPFVKNTILARLSLPDLAAIGPFLEPVVLRERAILHEPNKPVAHIYLIESGLISLRVVAAGGMIETAVLGLRGAVAASCPLGMHLSTHQAVVIVPGTALRISVNDLRSVMSERPAIRRS